MQRRERGGGVLVRDVAVGEVAHLLGVRQAIAGNRPQGVLQAHHRLVAQFDVAIADVAVIVAGNTSVKGSLERFELLLQHRAAAA